MHGLDFLDRRGGLDHDPFLRLGGHQPDILETRLGDGVERYRVVELIEDPGVTAQLPDRLACRGSIGGKERIHVRGRQAGGAELGGGGQKGPSVDLVGSAHNSISVPTLRPIPRPNLSAGKH